MSEPVEPACDLVVVGGGLVGASLACALDGTGLRTAVIEPRPPDGGAEGAGADRDLALAYGTRRILERIGVWPALASRAAPVRAVRVSERGRFGSVCLDAGELGLEALGYVASSADLAAALSARLRETQGVTLYNPARLTGLDVAPETVTVRLEGESAPAVLHARLIVGADGADSLVREALGIGARRTAYDQSAVTARVRVERSHRYRAHERFTPQGPLAVLPVDETSATVIWSVADEALDQILALDDEGFAAALEAELGYRLGRLRAEGPRRAHRLGLVRAHESVRPRAALIGNAAHTLHPVAAQGFNLGLRDAATLAALLAAAADRGEDPGDPALLERYARRRHHDQRWAITFTDVLARLFTNPWGPARRLRQLGMLGLTLLPPARRAFAARAAGLAALPTADTRALERG